MACFSTLPFQEQAYWLARVLNAFIHDGFIFGGMKFILNFRTVKHLK